MLVSICIPTCKTVDEISEQLDEIYASSPKTPLYDVEIIFSCLKASASINRNYCLEKALGDIIIQCDDDITGFYNGWINDLIFPLLNNDDIGIVSARLLNKNKKIAFMSGDTGNTTAQYFDTKDSHLCTATFVLKRNDLKFDENFIGSGFEDTDYGISFKNLFPDKRIVIVNDCQLIHLNEMKNQSGKNWEHNKAYFLNKHKNVKDTWHG